MLHRLDMDRRDSPRGIVLVTRYWYAICLSGYCKPAANPWPWRHVRQGHHEHTSKGITMDFSRIDIIEHDLEMGSAVALVLAAAGYEVETDINDNVMFISAEGEPEVLLPEPEMLAHAMRERMCELDEMSNEFHPAA
ncbi:MAG TPA: hypothetical protein VFE62_07470 [Gemmataceae bacterium]|nr:hypothetical protein [Gemmataceae bacterium]